MNIIKRIIENARQKAQTKRNAVIRNEAESLFQIREFNGGIYVCYRDMPIVVSTGIEQLESVRGTYIEYRIKNKN